MQEFLFVFQRTNSLVVPIWIFKAETMSPVAMGWGLFSISTPHPPRVYIKAVRHLIACRCADQDGCKVG